MNTRFNIGDKVMTPLCATRGGLVKEIRIFMERGYYSTTAEIKTAYLVSYRLPHPTEQSFYSTEAWFDDSNITKEGAKK